MAGPAIRPSEPADCSKPRVSPYSVGSILSVARALRVGPARELPSTIKKLAKRWSGSARLRDSKINPKERMGSEILSSVVSLYFLMARGRIWVWTKIERIPI